MLVYEDIASSSEVIEVHCPNVIDNSERALMERRALVSRARTRKSEYTHPIMDVFDTSTILCDGDREDYVVLVLYSFND